jgi:transcriptional regulator with XRE-family HTH domain
MVDGDGETLGALIARVRAEQGISQLRLAERLCAASAQPTVTRHEVSRWEREERVPAAAWLSWLAAVLDVPLADLERAATMARRARAGRPRRPARRRRGRTAGAWVRLRAGVYRTAS